MALLHCELDSKSVRMPTSVMAILPHDVISTSQSPKVLYLLHGCSHNYSVWSRYTSLERYCLPYNLAVIMPEVNRSFYTDMAYGPEYFTYITEELPGLCESMFHISTSSEDRYIAGMSMGGYGCLKAALSHPECYTGCAAISAVTNIHTKIESTPDSAPKKRDFRAIFGENLLISNQDDLYTLALQAKASGKPLPDFHLFCGTKDHFYQEILVFCDFLKKQEFSVSFDGWTGTHDWDFWDQAIFKVITHFFN